MRTDNSLYHKACEIATQNGFIKGNELFEFYDPYGNGIKLIISPKPNGGLLICVENNNDVSPIFLDREGTNLIEPIIKMITMFVGINAST
jgi:hypothetical protein